jgi:hypothetical protein
MRCSASGTGAVQRPLVRLVGRHLREEVAHGRGAGPALLRRPLGVARHRTVTLAGAPVSEREDQGTLTFVLKAKRG